MSGINREYKDRLFSFLFGREENKEWTLQLYNAVNGSKYQDVSAIEINTMEETLYMGMKNDVSFILYPEVNIYAHQSTYNPNMPLRELSYLSLLYNKYARMNNPSIYSSRQIELPVPKLVVFYNGTSETEDETILELKDAFPEGIDPSESDVQVRVRMLNINYGRNKELLKSCKPLMEYAWFISRIRQHRGDDEEIKLAVDRSIDEMPENYLIKKVLIANRAEVEMMLITEYNEQETMEQFKEEGREEGREDMLNAVQGLRSGKSEEDLRLAGMDEATIRMAKMCL